jgi:hypothetical protein
LLRPLLAHARLQRPQPKHAAAEQGWQLVRASRQAHSQPVPQALTDLMVMATDRDMAITVRATGHTHIMAAVLIIAGPTIATGIIAIGKC